MRAETETWKYREAFFMKDLMTRRLIFSTFMALMLTFSIQDIANALLREIVIPQIPKPPKLESSRKDGNTRVAAKGDIVISEIMSTTDIYKLPQWIEPHNRSTRKVSLEGWEVTIENHPEDTTVFATTLTFTLSAVILDANQVLLLVTEQGDNASVGASKGYLRADNIVILKNRIGGTPGYRFLSQTAFKVTLTAPATTETPRKLISDTAGNLGAIPEWGLPLVEGERSSIIRRYDGDDTSDGTIADGWELAKEKSIPYAQTTYYGHHSDYGTPGYRKADALPVKLSHFRPARGKSNGFRLAREMSSGVITITWTTESETNNAGFFIRRSQQRDDRSKKIINVTMIPGADTTNKKQSYTFTDTTAKPNVVYYYQLDCVSVDGTRRTLTRPTRLKGHVGSYRLFEEAPFWWRDLNR